MIPRPPIKKIYTKKELRKIEISEMLTHASFLFFVVSFVISMGILLYFHIFKNII